MDVEVETGDIMIPVSGSQMTSASGLWPVRSGRNSL